MSIKIVSCILLLTPTICIAEMSIPSAYADLSYEIQNTQTHIEFAKALVGNTLFYNADYCGSEPAGACLYPTYNPQLGSFQRKYSDYIKIWGYVAVKFDGYQTYSDAGSSRDHVVIEATLPDGKKAFMPLSNFDRTLVDTSDILMRKMAWMLHDPEIVKNNIAQARDKERQQQAEDRARFEESFRASQESIRLEAERVAKQPCPRIGMTIAQGKNTCWGKPDSINRTRTASSVTEQWVFGDGHYLYFKNGRLTVIQD